MRGRCASRMTGYVPSAGRDSEQSGESLPFVSSLVADTRQVKA